MPDQHVRRQGAHPRVLHQPRVSTERECARVAARHHAKGAQTRRRRAAAVGFLPRGLYPKAPRSPRVRFRLAAPAPLDRPHQGTSSAARLPSRLSTSSIISRTRVLSTSRSSTRRRAPPLSRRCSLMATDELPCMQVLTAALPPAAFGLRSSSSDRPPRSCSRDRTQSADRDQRALSCTGHVRCSSAPRLCGRTDRFGWARRLRGARGGRGEGGLQSGGALRTPALHPTRSSLSPLVHLRIDCSPSRARASCTSIDGSRSSPTALAARSRSRSHPRLSSRCPRHRKPRV